MSYLRPIRIGYCIDSFGIGGTELNAVRSIEALDLDRFQVTVFHFHEDGPIRSRYETLRVRMIHLPISRLYTPATAIQGLRLVRIIREQEIQIVHTHDVYTNIFAVPWARIFGRCRVIASRRWLYETPRPGLTPLNRWSYRFATLVLANSPSVAQLLATEEHVPLEKIVVLPNFLEERVFRRIGATECAARRKEWGIPEECFVVGIVARLVAVKNHGLLLRALRQLDDGVHAVVVGDGPERASLEALAGGLGIQSRVHFLGQVISPVNVHQFFDVSVLCSESEGFPNAVIEALAAERPVIATAVGGIVDVIKDNETGLLVPAQDPEALAEGIRRLRSDADVRKRIAEEGLAQVRARFHESVVIARLGALYTNLAQSTHGRGASSP